MIYEEELVELVSRLENISEFFRINFIEGKEPTYTFNTALGGIASVEMPCSANVSDTDLVFRKMHFDLFRWASRATELAKHINDYDSCYITCSRWTYMHLGTRSYNLIGDYMFAHNIGEEHIWQDDNGNQRRSLQYNDYVTIMEDEQEDEE